MKRAVSGIQSSGALTLGNYIGAIRNFVKMQEEYEMYVFVANLHSITVPQVKKDLLKNTKDIVALYLACGLDPKQTTIFLQSDVLAHTQLGWIMQCHTYIGELNRMTQFKDKTAKSDGNIGVGLFTYPSLMAADILLYDADYVPVGEDQKQHLELTRDLAQRFNNLYQNSFVVPEPIIQKEGARIMSLTDPTKKMSKSDVNSHKSCIFLLDDYKAIIKKIKSATTDNVGAINYDPINQPGISNLLVIYSQLANISVDEALTKFKDYNYASFKEEVAIFVADHLQVIQDKYHEVLTSGVVDQVLDEGMEKANQIAFKKLRKIKDKIGLNLKRSK